MCGTAIAPASLSRVPPVRAPPPIARAPLPADGPPGRIFANVWTPHFAEYARFDLNSTHIGMEDQLSQMRASNESDEG